MDEKNLAQNYIELPIPEGWLSHQKRFLFENFVPSKYFMVVGTDAFFRKDMFYFLTNKLDKYGYTSNEIVAICYYLEYVHQRLSHIKDIDGQVILPNHYGNIIAEVEGIQRLIELLENGGSIGKYKIEVHQEQINHKPESIPLGQANLSNTYLRDFFLTFYKMNKTNWVQLLESSHRSLEYYKGEVKNMTRILIQDLSEKLNHHLTFISNQRKHVLIGYLVKLNEPPGLKFINAGNKDKNITPLDDELLEAEFYAPCTVNKKRFVYEEFERRLIKSVGYFLKESK